MRKHRTYTGLRKPDGTTAVLVDHHSVLAPRLDLRQHGTEGLEWGYGEGGPAQLALAILADYLEDDERALALYQHFKRRVIWKLPAESWTLSGADIDGALDTLEAQTARERLVDLLGVAMKATCHVCGKRKTFWAHDRHAVLAQIDDFGWRENLAADGEVRFRCPDCLQR